MKQLEFNELTIVNGGIHPLLLIFGVAAGFGAAYSVDNADLNVPLTDGLKRQYELHPR